MSEPEHDPTDLYRERVRELYNERVTVTITVYMRDASDCEDLRSMKSMECNEGSPGGWLQPHDDELEIWEKEGDEEPNLPIGLFEIENVELPPKPNFDKDEGENRWIT